MSFFGSLAKIIGVAAAPVTGGASLGLTALSAGADLIGGAMANSAAAKNASAQRSFQEQMSNTSYQRAVADMRAAHLNPALAYSQGGASTPMGVSAPVQNITAGASNKMMQLAQLQNTAADTKNKVLGSSKIAADVANTNANTAAQRIANAKAIADLARFKQGVKVDTSVLGKGVQWLDKVLDPVTTLLHGHQSYQSGAVDRYKRTGK